MPLKEVGKYTVSYLQVLDEQGNVDVKLEPKLLQVLVKGDLNRHADWLRITNRYFVRQLPDSSAQPAVCKVILSTRPRHLAIVRAQSQYIYSSVRLVTNVKQVRSIIELDWCPFRNGRPPYVGATIDE